jgi:hypothetical protein
MRPNGWKEAVMLTSRLTCGCSLFILVLIGPSLAQTQGRIDDDTIAQLTNPELYDEASVLDTIERNLSALRDIESLSQRDTFTQALRSASLFFLRFHLESSGEVEYGTIGKKLYIRMPKYEPQFKSFLLNSLEKLYDTVTLRWKDLGYTPPAGFIYVWIVSDVAEMERKFGRAESARAFTLPCRYIVVPYSAVPYDVYRNLQREAISKGTSLTVSNEPLDQFLEHDFNHSFAHELTHAFVDSTMGLKRSDELEKWFQEGIAIWMSRDNGALLSSEYKGYKNLFDYIRMKYGNEAFQAFLQKTIATSSVNEGLQYGLAISSPVQLRQQAASWERLLNRMKSALGAVLLIFFVWFVYRLIMGKSIGIGLLLLITLLCLYSWFLGYNNLATDSIRHAALLNYLALLPIALTLIEVARLRHFSREYPRILFIVQNLIKDAVKAEANIYSPKEFDAAKALLAQAHSYMQNGKPQRAIDRLRWAKETADRSMNNLSAKKAKKAKEVRESYDEAARSLHNLIERVEQMSNTEGTSVDGYEGYFLELMRVLRRTHPGRVELREQIRSEVDDLRAKLADAKESIAAAKFVSAENLIYRIRGRISELLAKIKVNETDF